MRRFVYTAAAALLIAGVVSQAGPAAAAAKPVVTTYTAMEGLPSAVPSGGTIAVTLTYHQHSSYRLLLWGLHVELWNACNCIPDNTAGTVATYRDPTDGVWRTAKSDGNGYPLWIGGTAGMILKPDQKITVPVRISVSRFRSGTYYLGDNGTTIGNAFNPDGSSLTVDDFTWRLVEQDQHRFTIGTAGTTRPKPAPTPTTRRTQAPAAKAAPTPTHSPTGPATHPPSASGSPSATWRPTEATPTLTPTATLAVVALDTDKAAGNLSVWVLAAGLVGAASMSGLITWRRRKRSAT